MVRVFLISTGSSIIIEIWVNRRDSKGFSQGGVLSTGKLYSDVYMFMWLCLHQWVCG